MLLTVTELNISNIFNEPLHVWEILWKAAFQYIEKCRMVIIKESTKFRINTNIKKYVLDDEPRGRQVLLVIAGEVNNSIGKNIAFTEQPNKKHQRW